MLAPAGVRSIRQSPTAAAASSLNRARASGSSRQAVRECRRPGSDAPARLGQVRGEVREDAVERRSRGRRAPGSCELRRRCTCSINSCSTILDLHPRQGHPQERARMMANANERPGDRYRGSGLSKPSAPPRCRRGEAWPFSRQLKCRTAARERSDTSNVRGCPQLISKSRALRMKPGGGIGQPKNLRTRRRVRELPRSSTTVLGFSR